MNISNTVDSIPPPFPFTFLCRPKKSNKRNPPCDCGNPPEPDDFRGAGKNSLNAVVCRYRCFDIACRARRVHWLRSAQTVCPRDPRKPSGSGPHRNGLASPDQKGLLAGIIETSYTINLLVHCSFF